MRWLEEKRAEILKLWCELGWRVPELRAELQLYYLIRADGGRRSVSAEAMQ